MTEYTVILEPGESGWGAYVPDLPGCIATGKTRALVESRIREAIVAHIAFLRSEGDPVPPPSSRPLLVAVAS